MTPSLPLAHVALRATAPSLLTDGMDESSPLQRAAERYVVDPSPANGRAMAVAALPLVRAMVRRVSLPDHPLASYRDLEHAGMLGMLQALQGYDPTRGTSFASFAYGRIRGALVDFLRTIDALSRDRRRRVAEAARAADELQQELGAEPRAAQVALRLGVSVSEYDRLRTDAQQRFTMSLYDGEDSEHRPVPLDTIAHPDPEEEMERFEQQSLYTHVAALLKRYPEREQRIVTLYFFEGQTLRQIAEALSLTEARISQILSKTLRTLRTQVQVAQETV
jgi:RNA polymerase sigma factor for flagellar operon FliA